MDCTLRHGLDDIFRTLRKISGCFVQLVRRRFSGSGSECGSGRYHERLPFLSQDSEGVRDSVIPRYFTEPVAYAVLPEYQADFDT